MPVLLWGSEGGAFVFNGSDRALCVGDDEFPLVAPPNQSSATIHGRAAVPACLLDFRGSLGTEVSPCLVSTISITWWRLALVWDWVLGRQHRVVVVASGQPQVG